MHDPLISYYTNLNTVAGDVPVSELITAIRTGLIQGISYSDTITRIRKETDKNTISKLKKGLPKVTLSGTFDQHRINDKFLSHSGLLQIDIDELPPDVASYAELRKTLQNDKYTFACFSSPSDKLKLIVKIPSDKESHLAAFLAVESYYLSKYQIKIDRATKDVTRLCFLSYDPEIFINQNSAVYTKITVAATPQKKTPPRAPNYPTTDKSTDIENCLQQIERNRIDITGSYADWVKIGFAIADGFGETGRDYYHRVSIFYSGYNTDETNAQYTNCLKGNGKNKVQLASFFQACKDYGIDTKRPLKAVQKLHKNEQKTAQTNHREGTGQIDDFKKPINPDCENADEFLAKNEFYYKDGCYYTTKQYKTKTHAERISNFIMEFLYFFPDGSNNAKWYIKIQSNTGELAQIELTAKDLNSVSAFKPAIMSKGRYSFSGNQAQLDKIIEYHNTQYSKAHKIACLGWQAEHNIYAYSNGIIDGTFTFIPANKMGIVSCNDNSYYLPALSELTKEDTSYLNERKFIYKPGSLSFADYNKHMVAAYGVNGAIGNAYLIAAIFRDIIFAERASFPYLFLFGEAGSGKTTFTDLHLSVFGNPQPGIGISNDSTSKSIARRISQFKNALTYIKEYTNNDVDSSTIGLLKTGYEGVGYDRAQTSNDNKTHQTGVFSGIFIDGNELPEKNSALFSRTITITFEKTDFTTQQQVAKDILKDAAESGFGQIFVEIARHRQLMSAEFGNTYRKAIHYLKNERCKNLGLADRTIEHIALLIAPIRILKAHLNFHINVEEMIGVLIAAANAQNEAMKETNEIQTFFKTLEYLSSDFKIKEGYDYHIKIDATGVEVFSFVFENVYNKYAEQCIKQRMPPTGKASLKAFLKNKPFTIRSTQKGSEFTPYDKDLKKRVWRFDYKALNIEMQRTGVYGTV